MHTDLIRSRGLCWRLFSSFLLTFSSVFPRLCYRWRDRFFVRVDCKNRVDESLAIDCVYRGAGGETLRMFLDMMSLIRR